MDYIEKRKIIEDAGFRALQDINNAQFHGWMAYKHGADDAASLMARALRDAADRLDAALARIDLPEGVE